MGVFLYNFVSKGFCVGVRACFNRGANLEQPERSERPSIRYPYSPFPPARSPVVLPSTPLLPRRQKNLRIPASISKYISRFFWGDFSLIYIYIYTVYISVHIYKTSRIYITLVGYGYIYISFGCIYISLLPIIFGKY